MALTGPLAANGKQALLGAQIWAGKVNAKGGLLGRQVQLVNYDDQSNPATVPGIYTKLLDVDKVDLIVSGYATNMVAPAIPIAMQRNKVFIGLFALAANSEFHYPKYFSMLPSGPDAEGILHRGLLPDRRGAKSQAADHRHCGRGCRLLAQCRRRRPHQREKIRPQDGLRQDLPAEHDRLLADRARHPGRQCGSRRDLLLSAELGRHRAVRQRTRPEAENVRRRHGRLAGDRVQEQAQVQAQRHRQLRDLGAVAEIDGAGRRLLQNYQSRAPGLGIDPLGYYLGGWGYAYFQVLQQAIEGTKSINDDKLAAYMRSHPFNTIMASDIKFGKDGEWTKSGMLQVQYHGITDAADLETWRGMSYQTVLTPADEKTGNVIYPYAKALG